MEPALGIQNINSGYKGAIILRDLSLSVDKGEAVALFGKNGMGKTTLLKTIMGYLPKKGGSVHLFGKDITRTPTHRIANMGVSYASQEQPLFADLSIQDNLGLGLARESEFEERFADIEPIFPVFKSRLKQLAGTLSGGEQKMLLVARGLMMRPSFILLDEITEGLQPTVIARIVEALKWERQQRGTTMLIIEQNVPFALQVADRYLVLKQGEIIASGETDSAESAESVMRHLRV